jgi:chromosomal replication initiator protein
MSDFWKRCQERLASENRAVYDSWLAELTLEEGSDPDSGQITLTGAAASKMREVQKNHGEMIAAAVSAVAGHPVEILFRARKNPAQTPAAAPEPAQDPAEDLARTGLLPKLTFDNFVEGKANQFAYAAALQVATSPRAIYNPLFIYGGVGLGKTHLMHAIGHEFRKLHPHARVRCVSAQQYMQEFMEAVRQKAEQPELMRQFEAKYQDLDLFLIDDIQSFGKREGTQTNFFLVFENMVPHGKQIVLTSDTYPKSLKDFQERLLSRMTQGLTVEVEPPELEMRVQILHQKAKSIGLDLPEEVAEVIAEHLKSNVRELEGAVQQIYAFTHFSKMPVTLESVKLALRDVFRQNSVPVTLESIQQRVAEYYNLKQADMTSKSRIAPVAKARQIAMYLCKELTQKSLPEIGKSFGGRDHATVIHAHKKITAERTRDEALRHDLNVLTQRIKN